MSQSDKDQLLAMLAENEDDEATRVVLADLLEELLEELGEDDEAHRHRNWMACQRWMIPFLAEIDDHRYAETANGFRDLMDLLSDINDTDDIRIYVGAYES